MVKKIVGSVAEEWLEIGKQTIKSAGQVVTGKKEDSKINDEVVKSLYGIEDDQTNAKKVQDDDRRKKLDVLDRKKSAQRYKEIQDKIKLFRKKKKQEPRKYETGRSGFDEEQVKDPESYFEKLKKEQEEVKNKEKSLSIRAKKSIGTGEVGRGVSG